MDLRSQQRYQAQPRYEAPAQAQQPTAGQQPQALPAEPTRSGRGLARFPIQDVRKYMIYAAIALGITLVAWYLLANGAGSIMSTVKKDQYQAVFLSNGQVYFGKIKNADSTTVTMSDIYYLQQAVQGTKDDKTADKEQAQMSLTKLGNEIHGPEDTMYIQKDQVLFWENLKTDSQVVKSIKNTAKQN